jgi:sulfate permease, SulP family
MPLSSTGSGTAAMSAAGGNTSLGGIIAASFVAVGLVGFPGVLGRIPLPALAAVVCAAAIGLVDVDALRDLWRISRAEWVVAITTAASVVLFDVLVGVLLSVVLSVVLAISRMTRPHDAVLGHAVQLDGWVDVAAYPDAVTEPGLVVYRFDAPLLFTNADRYCARVLDALHRQPGDERWLVLDLEGVGSIDATAVVALRRLVDDVHRDGVQVIAVARANHLTLERLRRAGLLQPDGTLLVVPTINAAVRGFRASGGPDP